IFDVVNVALIRGAGRLTRVLFPPRLQAQVLLILCAALIAGLLPMLLFGWSRGEAALTPLDPLFVLLWVAGGACAVGAALQAKFHRLVALILVGGVGLVTCLTFAWFSAPDLALTQISVEVVTLVLMLLGLRWLPKRLEIDDPTRRTPRARVRRARDVVLAVVAGTGLASLAYAIMTRPRGEGIARFFMEHALPDSGG